MKAEEMALLIYELYLIMTRLDLDATIKLPRPIATQYAKLKDTYNSAVIAARDAQNHELKSFMVTLTSEQRQRKYLIDGKLPDDEQQRICPFCHNHTLDEPNTNEGNRRKNEAAMSEYYKRKQEIDKMGSTIGKKGKETVRVTKPTLLPVYFQCHAHEMHCTNKNSDIGSTCIIKCKYKDETTGEYKRYPYDEGTLYFDVLYYL